eukprot:TRINITY_DN4978_c0_g1_i2.p1 TRINITY_DN4978_c0_g1~~TRINITY_DN4978_c0_g1_i2.p1  ORF type:complete len:1287 (+),score=312.62 TRINITY_DN4978_c0_g1_i2:411-4271(+)
MFAPALMASAAVQWLRCVCLEDVGNMEFLLQQGFDINRAVDPELRADVAERLAQEEEHANERVQQIIKTVRQRMASVIRDDDTALHTAILLDNSAMVDLLLAQGASLDIAGAGNLTPEELATDLGRDQLLSKFDLEKTRRAELDMARLIAADMTEQLFVAIDEDDTEKALEALSKGANPNAVGEDGLAPIHYACQLGNDAILAILLDARGDFGVTSDPPAVSGAAPSNANFTPLHFAAEKGSLACADLLLARGADHSPLGGPLRDETPLFRAACRGHVTLLSRLLAAGADPNCVCAGHQYSTGDTPLHRSPSDCVAVLLAHGANPNARNNTDTTPLHLAAEDGDVDCVRALLEAGADTSARNKYNETPLDLAKSTVVQALLQPNSSTSSGAFLSPPTGLTSRRLSLSKAETLEHTPGRRRSSVPKLRRPSIPLDFERPAATQTAVDASAAPVSDTVVPAVQVTDATSSETTAVPVVETTAAAPVAETAVAAATAPSAEAIAPAEMPTRAVEETSVSAPPDPSPVPAAPVPSETTDFASTATILAVQGEDLVSPLILVRSDLRTPDPVPADQPPGLSLFSPVTPLGSYVRNAVSPADGSDSPISLSPTPLNDREEAPVDIPTDFSLSPPPSLPEKERSPIQAVVPPAIIPRPTTTTRQPEPALDTQPVISPRLSFEFLSTLEQRIVDHFLLEEIVTTTESSQKTAASEDASSFVSNTFVDTSDTRTSYLRFFAPSGPTDTAPPREVGLCRLFYGKNKTPLSKLVHLSLHMPEDVTLHWLFGFSEPESALPHFMCMCAETVDAMIVSADLIPRVPLDCNSNYVAHVYTPLSGIARQLSEISGISSTALPPAMAALLSPWRLSMRVPKAIFQTHVAPAIRAYAAHWRELIDTPFDAALLASLFPPSSALLAHRDRALRENIFNPRVWSYWESVERRIGTAATAQLRRVLFVQATSTKKKVLVIGATGRLGRVIVDTLLAQEFPTRVLVRRDSQNPPLPSHDLLDVVYGDVTQPESVKDLFFNIKFVIIALAKTSFFGSHADILDTGVRMCLERGQGSGVQHILLLSCFHIHTRTSLSATMFSDWYAAMWAAECHVRATGIPFTIYRPATLVDLDEEEEEELWPMLSEGGRVGENVCVSSVSGACVSVGVVAAVAVHSLGRSECAGVVADLLASLTPVPLLDPADDPIPRRVESGDDVARLVRNIVPWRADSDSLVCTKCGSQFGLFLRRHHCRVCGGLFCASCSSRTIKANEWVAPAFQHEGMVRCCDSCYGRKRRGTMSNHSLLSLSP